MAGTPVSWATATRRITGALVGLLHDIDFEQFPEEHCIKAPELLRAGGVGEDVIHAVCSHGWGLTVDVKPEHEMEKVLFAADELTGLIWATALMRPSKSLQDLGLKSVKKKFKQSSFAAGCSREVIQQGADLLGMAAGRPDCQDHRGHEAR